MTVAGKIKAVPALFRQLEAIATKYNATIQIGGKLAVIHYPKLGLGTIISGEIQTLPYDFRIKMTPADLTLEVELNGRNADNS